MASWRDRCEADPRSGVVIPGATSTAAAPSQSSPGSAQVTTLATRPATWSQGVIHWKRDGQDIQIKGKVISTTRHDTNRLHWDGQDIQIKGKVISTTRHDTNRLHWSAPPQRKTYHIFALKASVELRLPSGQHLHAWLMIPPCLGDDEATTYNMAADTCDATRRLSARRRGGGGGWSSYSSPRRRAPAATASYPRRRSWSVPTSYSARRRAPSPPPPDVRRRAPPPPVPSPIETRRRTTSISGQSYATQSRRRFPGNLHQRARSVDSMSVSWYTSYTRVTRGIVLMLVIQWSSKRWMSSNCQIQLLQVMLIYDGAEQSLSNRTATRTGHRWWITMEAPCHSRLPMDIQARWCRWCRHESSASDFRLPLSSLCPALIFCRIIRQQCELPRSINAWPLAVNCMDLHRISFVLFWIHRPWICHMFVAWVHAQVAWLRFQSLLPFVEPHPAPDREPFFIVRYYKKRSYSKEV